MKKIMCVLLSCLVVFGSPAFARCKQSDVKGIWNIYFGVGFVSRCTLRAPQINSGSYCYVPQVINAVPLTGFLKLDKNCHVSGNLIINNAQFNVDAWISKDKETISGMSWDPASGVGGIFSGVKM